MKFKRALAKKKKKKQNICFRGRKKKLNNSDFVKAQLQQAFVDKDEKQK